MEDVNIRRAIRALKHLKDVCCESSSINGLYFPEFSAVWWKVWTSYIDSRHRAGPIIPALFQRATPQQILASHPIQINVALRHKHSCSCHHNAYSVKWKLQEVEWSLSTGLIGYIGSANIFIRNNVSINQSHQLNLCPLETVQDAPVHRARMVCFISHLLWTSFTSLTCLPAMPKSQNYSNMSLV